MSGGVHGQRARHRRCERPRRGVSVAGVESGHRERFGRTSPLGRTVMMRSMEIVRPRVRRAAAPSTVTTKPGPGASPLSRARPSPALDAVFLSERQTEAASSGGGAAAGEESRPVPAEPPWRRRAAGTGRSPRSVRLPLLSWPASPPIPVTGAVEPISPGSTRDGASASAGLAPQATPHTPPTAPGSLTGAVGSGALALRAPSAGTRAFGQWPGRTCHSSERRPRRRERCRHSRVDHRAPTVDPPEATGSSGTNPAAPLAADVGKHRSPTSGLRSRVSRANSGVPFPPRHRRPARSAVQ